MVALILAILALGILVIVHEAGHFLAARASKMRVELFSVGFGPPIWRLTRGETTYQVAAVPLGGFVQISGMNPGEEIDPEDPRAYPNRPAWQRFITIFAGPGINYVFAALLLIGLNLAIGVPVEVKSQGAVVIYTVKDHPADKAGMRPGDEIVAISGSPVSDAKQVAPLIEASQGRPLQIEALREGQRKTFVVTAQKDKGSGKWRIGISPDSFREERKPLGAWKAIRHGLTYPLRLTWANVKIFADFFRGQRKDLELGGPVEIVETMQQNIKRGWVRGLEMVAFISTMLGFFNLMPMPALDGGRLVFLGWELVTRRPVNPRVEQVVHGVGMVLLLLLVGFLLLRGMHRLALRLIGGG